MRAIDADAMIDRLKAWDTKDKTDKALYNFTLNRIIEQPTIQPEPHWIPVEQALPELRHDVLLTVFFHERWNVAEGYRQDGEFMFWNHGRLDSALDEENRVIAWMPKPEPYKGVTECLD